MIYQHLFERVTEPQTVRAGLIGCGDFGTTIVSMAPLIPRLDLAAVADLDLEAARAAYRTAGYADDDIAICESHTAALSALEAGRRVVVPDASLLMDLPLHVIASATRVPEAGARYGYEAIQHGKHLVLVDKETDSVVGPMLKYLADRAGVVCTTDDGDEPGLLMGMVSWARALGLEVLCGGNMHHCLHDPVAHTITDRKFTVPIPPDDRWALERVPAGQARRYAAARHRLCAPFHPYENTGDPMAHMAVAANGTGLMPDTPCGHRPVARFVELPEILCPVEDGGILATRGAIEIPAILHTADQPTGGGGVFVVVANRDAHSRAVMIHKGLIANASGSAMLVYRPHHLCGAETAMSILCAGLLRVPTGGREVLPRVDIIAETTRAFPAGHVFGVEEGTTAFGFSHDYIASLAPGGPLGDDRPLPYYMLYGNTLRQDVPAGTVITRAMVEPPGDSVLWSLRAQQDRLFFG